MDYWKLIKLLNEYCKEKKYDTVWYEKGWLLKFEPTKRLTQWVISWIVISKHYGFIDRLVESDKIDRDKVWETEKKQIVRIQRTIENIKILRYTTLLMLLAIQDEPLQFLSEIIK